MFISDMASDISLAPVDVKKKEPITQESSLPNFETNTFSHISPTINENSNLPHTNKQIFSSMLVTSKIDSNADCSVTERISQLLESPPVAAILNAAEKLSCEKDIPLTKSMEQIIGSLRELDELWTQVLFREGLNHLGKSIQ